MTVWIPPGAWVAAGTVGSVVALPHGIAIPIQIVVAALTLRWAATGRPLPLWAQPAACCAVAVAMMVAPLGGLGHAVALFAVIQAVVSAVARNYGIRRAIHLDDRRIARARWRARWELLTG